MRCFGIAFFSGALAAGSSLLRGEFKQTRDFQVEDEMVRAGFVKMRARANDISAIKQKYCLIALA
jgi:hypothetical protein